MAWWVWVLFAIGVTTVAGVVAIAVWWRRSGKTRAGAVVYFKSLGVDLAKLPGRLRGVASDPRTPRRAAWWLSGLALYIVFPFDPLPDFIPIIGQLDELVIAPLVLWHVRRMIPDEVWFEYFPPKPGRAERVNRE